MNKRLLIVLFLSTFIYSLLSCSESIDSQLKKVAEEDSRNYPLMLDQWTRLDSNKVLPDRTIRYYYTLLEITVADTTLLKSHLKPQIISTLKTDNSLRFYKENNIIMQHFYKDTNGNYLFSVVADPKEYN